MRGAERPVVFPSADPIILGELVSRLTIDAVALSEVEKISRDMLKFLRKLYPSLCYISGPFASFGDPAENMTLHQAAAKSVYRNHGLAVWNPLWSGDLRRFGIDNHAAGAFHIGLIQERFFTHMAFRPGWAESFGAKLEHDAAMKLGLERIYLSR